MPALAESEFGVPAGSFLLLTSFVVVFGVVKSGLNFVAGRMSERVGRRRVLMLGWLAALPVPFLIYFAQDWGWIIAATVLLGVNQGLAWSMTQASKLDLAGPHHRGVTIGLNEFAGYVGVALAGVVTGYAASIFDPRLALLLFGLVVVLGALVSTRLWVKETLPWATAEASRPSEASPAARSSREPRAISQHPSTWEVFAVMSWRDRRLAAICQAGLVEKFVDALVWVIYPVFLFAQGLSLPTIGWIVGVYGFAWGGLQLFTGRLSDRIGRHGLNVAGMWICGLGVALMPVGEGVLWWSVSAVITGVGMALLYPNLSAAIADISAPSWRGSAIGIYRFWRDLGYAIGALGLGVAAHLAGQLDATFWFVAVSMFLSGLVLLWFGEGTHPKAVG